MKIRVYARKLALLSALLSCTAAAMAQVAVTGVVRDTSGEPVIGASILVVGTTNGTITDIDGNFAISVAEDATLKVTYVGYRDEEVAVSGQTRLLVTLQEDAEVLDDVVVVGYGVVKKNDATGSVTAIKPDEMNKGLVTNAQDMLQGKIAGVNITNSGGAPGAGATIRIRGGSSLSASNDPLIVIDGLAMDNDGIQGVSNPLALVNPNDIESFTVLKDASATAIYGSRASNGVIIITTKKGAKNQKLKVAYNGSVSASVLTDRVSVMSASELQNYALELGIKEKTLSKFGNYNTDWQDEIYRLGISTDHNINLTGGTKHMPYRVSLGYTDQNGTIKTSNMQRGTVAVNLSPSFLDDHLSFNLNAKGMYIYNRYADGGVVGSALDLDPTQPVYDESLKGFGGYYQRTSPGSYNDSDPTWDLTNNTQSTANPVSTLELKNDRAHSGSFVGNLEADYKIHGFEDLRLHANFGADYSYGKQTTSISPYSFSNHYYGWEGYTEKMKYNLLFNAYAQYYKDFNENHHFDIMAGYEWQHFYNEGSTDGWGLYRPTSQKVDADGNSLANTQYNRSTNTWKSESYLVSFFGRLNYIALNRYMVTATVRGDGSSRFAPSNRWGVFPSVALGWKIKEEAFLKDVYWLSDLKLRLGYGITGQQNINQGDYPYLPTYTVSREHVAFVQYNEATGEYEYYQTWRPNAYNPDLTWEKTTTYNAGLDFGFLRGRITGSIDYYYRNTTDLINEVDIPAETNFKTRVIKNVGSLRNTGLEFMLNAVAIDTKKLKWDLGFNLTWNDNKITKLIDGDNKGYFIADGDIGNSKRIQAHAVGHPASSFYVYQTEINDAGQRVIVDQNNDGKITTDDKVFYHSPNADVTMGLTSKWQFYGFDLGITLRASIGNYVYNKVLADNMQNVEKGSLYDSKSGGFHNVMWEAYNARWIDGVKRTDYTEPALLDYWVENASFLRCDNITLGYTWAKPKINARLYCTVSNPFVISKYRGLDPEVFGGIDNNIYPRSMTILVGTSLSF